MVGQSPGGDFGESSPGTESSARRRRSRRALLGGAGAGALLLAGCGGSPSAARAARPSPAVAAHDVEILTRLLELERLTVASYVAFIPLLPHPDAQAAEQFLSEELEHTGELISLISAARGKAGPRASSYDVGQPADLAQVLALLHSRESMQLAAYLSAIPRLTPGPLRASVASILTVDAQHVAMLRLLEGRDPVPVALVTGAQ